MRPLLESDLLAVDPGLRNPAAAFFRAGRLVAASRVQVPAALAKLEIGERSLAVARLIATWFAEQLPLNSWPVDLRIAYEHPQVYQRPKSKGDPNDLLPLAGVGMCVVGLLGAVVVEVHSPTPAEWIGQIPKSTTGDPWESARGKKIGRRLDDVERAAVVTSHDAIDAAGIGLHVLGRLDRIRNFLGAT